jgi:O-antigen/teichoic acid export membrane protein
MSRLRASDATMVVANIGVRGATLASKFLLVIVLARFFPPEGLGLYGLMVSAVVIGLFVLGLEYKYFVVRELIARPVGFQAAVLRDQAVLYILTAAIALPILAVLVSWGLWSPIPAGAFTWLFALVLVELAAQEGGNALIGLSRPLAANVVLFVRSGMWVFPVVIAVWVSPAARDTSTIFLGWLLGAAASFGLAAYCLRGIGWRNALSRSIDWAAIRTGLRTSAPFLLTSGAALGLLFLDRFIIEANQGLAAVGIYTFFAGFATALHTLVNTGVSLIRMPRLVKAHHDNDEQGFRLEFGRMARGTAASGILLAVAIGLAIIPILRLVDRTMYSDNLLVFFLLLVAAFIRCLADPPLYALYARREDIRFLIASASAFGVSLIGNLVLVPGLGIAGAAMAAAAGALTLLVTALILAILGRGGTRATPNEQLLSTPVTV